MFSQITGRQQNKKDMVDSVVSLGQREGQVH
jgi:hypothetical protein